MNPLTKPTTETTPTMHDFPPPIALKHQPIFMVPYAPFDGPYAGSTDAKYLSIGLAQWKNRKDPDALSAKVWRHSGKKWSRLSEEIPLHRLADLCTLMVKTFYQDLPMTETAIIDAGTFEKQKQRIELRRLNDVPNRFSESETDRVKERLRKLREELNAADLD